MIEQSYIDLLVSDGGIDFDAGQQPQYTSDRNSIAQDVKHAILESGLVRKLQAERSRPLRADILTQIEMLIEQDKRIEPGTATTQERSAGEIWLFAETTEYGDVNMGISV